MAARPGVPAGADVPYGEVGSHPLSLPKEGEFATHSVHGCGRAVGSFCSWATEAGYLGENVMQRLKLPPILRTLPELLNEDQILRVLSIGLNRTLERLRNFST